jgi:hypothetical protein
MPDMAARMALDLDEDPADHDAAADVDPAAVCPKLGKVQTAVLKALRAVTAADEEVLDEQNGWVQYGRVPDAVIEFGYYGSTEGAHRSSVSRSVRSLAEEKYVAAAVKEWHRFYGMETTADEPNSLLSYGAEPWREFDDERAEMSSPKFSYLRLTAPGHKLARYLLDGDNADN